MDQSIRPKPRLGYDQLDGAGSMPSLFGTYRSPNGVAASVAALLAEHEAGLRLEQIVTSIAGSGKTEPLLVDLAADALARLGSLGFEIETGDGPDPIYRMRRAT